MDKNENTSSGATDTSAVTAIKVKVVVDTTTADLRKQFEGIQKDIKDDPIGLTFGVDTKTSKDAIIKGLQAILGKENNITIGASVDQNAGKKVQQGVQNAVNAGQQAANKNKVKVKVATDVDETTKKLNEFYSLVERVNTLNNKAMSLPEGKVNELAEYNKLIDEAGQRMKVLMNELSDKIEIGSMSQLESEMKTLDQRTAMVVARLKDAQIAAGKNEFASLVKEIGELNTKIETADYSKQTNQIQEWTRQLQVAESRLTELMNTYGEYINIEEGSDLDKLTQRVSNKENIAVAKKADSDKAKSDAESLAETNARLKEFYDLVKKVNDLNNKAQMLPEDSVRELEECNRQLDDMGERMTTLMNELSGNIEIGEFSKLDTIMNDLNNRSALLAARLEDVRAKANVKIFYGLIEEINNLNQKISTADPSKQSSQIEAWTARLSDAEEELTRLMTTYSEFINIGSGSKIDSLNQKLNTKNSFDFAKNLDEARQKIQGFQEDFNALELKLNSLGATVPGSESLTNLRNTLPELQRMISGLQGELDNAAQSGDMTRLNELFSQMSDALGFAGNAYKQFIQDLQIKGKVTDESNHLKELIRNLQEYRDALTSKFNNSGFEQDYEKLLAELQQGNISFKDAKAKVLDFKASCRQAGLEVETLGQKLSRLFKEHFQTAIAMAGVAMVKQGLREVYNNVLDIDTALTELRKVSSMTSSEMDDFLDSAASKARELGISISDYVNSTADWKRLGYTDDDAAELARISGLMKNVGDNIESAGDASSYLISVLQGFHLVADDAEQVLDVANQIANTQPVDMRDLMEGMQRSSSALFAAGNSYSEAMSMVAATNSVLQSPETTGTFLKTLSMYLRAAKTEATSAGLEIDGMANSVSELRSELKQLTGVDIMKDAAGTQFKSTYQIMKELSEVWDKLSDVSQANVTELIAGKRGGQAVSALLTNFDVAEKSMKEAANSAGSAIKENETYLDSINGKVAQLDAAFQQFSKDLLDSSLIKFFVDFATGAVDLADGAVKAAGALPTLAAAISGVLSVMQMSGKLKNGAGKVNMPSYIRCV